MQNRSGHRIEHEFLEDGCGVHVGFGTMLCGKVLGWYSSEGGSVQQTSKRTVSCDECVKAVKSLRGVRTI